MYFSRKCKITFVCNGATIFSEDDRFTDSENYPPLNEQGQVEIEKVCEFLKIRGVKNDNIYTSPATRCVQSASMISKIFKQDFNILEDLHPRKCGAFNGLTFEQIEEKYPDGLERLINNPNVPTPDDAESVSSFIERIKHSIDKIIEKNQGNRIIIVTHKDVIKAAVCSAMNMPDSSLHRVYIKSGSLTQISYFEHWSSLVYCDNKPM